MPMDSRPKGATSPRLRDWGARSHTLTVIGQIQQGNLAEFATGREANVMHPHTGSYMTKHVNTAKETDK